MVDAVVTSVWASVCSWSTPTVLFVLLNLVIGTIAITSKAARPVHDHPNDEHGLVHHHHRFPAHVTLHSLARSSSIVLERLRSISSFSRHRSVEIPAEDTVAAAAASVPVPPSFPRLTEDKGGIEILDDAYKAATDASPDHHFSRSQSDPQPTASEMPVNYLSKLKKSVSTNSATSHFEELEVVEKRPATVRPSQPPAMYEEVDAKADDFINRFRHQLKLQRLDSILRYKEMITGSR